MLVEPDSIPLSALWDLIPYASGDPFWQLWPTNRSYGHTFNVSGTTFGNAVENSGAVAVLHGDAIGDIDHQIRVRLEKTPACEPMTFTVKGSGSTTTKNIDGRDLYARIGTLQANWIAEVKATPRGQKQWDYKANASVLVWDFWQWGIPGYPGYQQFYWELDRKELKISGRADVKVK